MPVTDALQLDNMWPTTATVDLREGSEAWATGFVQNVETLIPFQGLSTLKIFGIDSTGIFDVTASGAIGATVLARTNGQHVYACFNTLGGSHTYAVNGVDKPAYTADGTTWVAVDGGTVPALTGLTTTTLKYVYIFKKRLWFIPNNSMSVWYLAIDAIGGALTEFPVGGLFHRGGYLVAGGTWTMDGGNGPDDYMVLVSSQGEAAIYSGIDPSSATTFTLQGVFYVGHPVGKRPLVKYGGDLLLITQTGIYPLSKALQSASISRTQLFSFKIDSVFSASANSYGDNYGWMGVVFPEMNALLFNIPVSVGSLSYQYVMNTITGAWTRFLEWNAQDFLVFNHELYMAVGKTVKKAWMGTSDSGANIVGEVRTAFNYFGSAGYDKTLQLFRPLLTTEGSLTINFGVDVDFADGGAPYSYTVSPMISALWDTAKWDAALWGSSPEVQKGWQFAPTYPGRAASLHLKMSTNSVSVSWSSTDYILTRGGMI